MTDLLPAVTTTVFDQLPDNFDDWAAFGQQLQAADTAINWAIGDWLLFGEAHWPDRYLAVAAATGLAQSTIANAVSVASRVSPAMRRADLPWATHREVMALEPDDQVRLLAVAADNGLSKRALRAYIDQEVEDRATHPGVRGADPRDPGTPIRPDDITPPAAGAGLGAPAPAASKPGTKRPVSVFEVTVPADQADAARRWLEQFTGPLHDRLVQAGAPGAIIEVR